MPGLQGSTQCVGSRTRARGPQRLYSRLISISLPGVSRLGAAKGPPMAAGWCPRAWRSRRRFPPEGRRPGPRLVGANEKRVGGIRSPTAHPRPLAPSQSLRLKASASREGEATRPCAVRTAQPPPENWAERALGLGKKFAEAVGSVGSICVLLTSPTRRSTARAPHDGSKLGVRLPCNQSASRPGLRATGTDLEPWKLGNLQLPQRHE